MRGPAQRVADAEIVSDRRPDDASWQRERESCGDLPAGINWAPPES
jgi:hypothetical protein